MGEEIYYAIMRIAIGFTCLGIFITTAIAVGLDLFNIIDIKKDIRTKLHILLTLEIVTISVAAFSGIISLRPKELVTQTVIQTEELDKKLQQKMNWSNL